MLDDADVSNLVELQKALGALSVATANVAAVIDKLISGPAVCSVILQSHGPNKIACIKAIREATSWGLKESKDFVENAPIVLQRKDLNLITPVEAAKTLRDAGAVVAFCKGTLCDSCDLRFKCFTSR